MKISEDKPWAKLRMSRRRYEALRIWKKCNMERSRFEEILVLLPDHLIEQMLLDADAEKLMDAIFSKM